MPVERWDGELLYSRNERGTIEQFIKRMMKHETNDHCKIVIKAIVE